MGRQASGGHAVTRRLLPFVLLALGIGWGIVLGLLWEVEPVIVRILR